MRQWIKPSLFYVITCHRFGAKIFFLSNRSLLFIRSDFYNENINFKSPKQNGSQVVSAAVS